MTISRAEVFVEPEKYAKYPWWPFQRTRWWLRVSISQDVGLAFGPFSKYEYGVACAVGLQTLINWTLKESK